MDSLANEIQQQILAGGVGKIYFISDFESFENEEVVKKTLFRLEKKGVIVRLSHGIYLYPNRSEKLGVLYPSVDDIAHAIAIRDKAEIMPTGALAMNILGFSTQVPMNAVFITNGTPRKIQIGKRKITFKQAAPKNFHFKSELMALLVSALKEIGQDNVDEAILSRIYELFSIRREFVKYREDLALAPVWIRKIVISVINKLTNE